MHRFIITAFLILCPILIAGQDIDQLYDLYSAKKIDELRAALAKTDVTTSKNPHLIFLNAVLLEDGDAAVQIYEKLIDNADNILKNHLTVKLAEYYYARGFYVKAQSWRARIEKTDPASKPLTQGKPYIIQVGAFGYEDNAHKLKKLLASHQIGCEIVKRKLGDKDLYCVWIAGKPNRDETEQMARNIEERLRLNYRIIQP